MNSIRLIGAGAIARLHAAANRSLPGGPLPLHVTDPSAAALASFCADIPEATAHASVAAMLAEPASADDVVVVATPPATHYQLTMAALASGRHVLCEKPLASTPDQASEMAAEATRRGRLLHDCSSRFLGYRTSEAAAALVRSGGLGRIYRIRWIHLSTRGRPGIEYQPSSRWFLDRSLSGGGVGVDWGVYDLAVLMDVLNPVSVTVATAWTAAPVIGPVLPAGIVCDVEHHLGAELVATLPDGSDVSITYERANGTHAIERDQAEIVGTSGSVAWQWVSWPGERMWLEQRSDRAGKIVIERHEYPTAAETDCHHRPLHGLIAAVRGQPNRCINGARAGRLLGILAAIYATAGDRIARTIKLLD